MIVEDHPTMREAMRAVLEQSGFAIREAADGKSALAQVAERKPDVILLDLNIPGMSGEEILRTLKGDPQTSGIKVIIVTALGQDAEKKVRELGADEFFMKPFSPVGILQTVDRVLAAQPAEDGPPTEQ